MKNYLLFILCISLLSCQQKKKEIQKNNFELNDQTGTEVELTTISSTLFHKEIISNGIIEAQQKSDLHFKMSERVERIYFRNGESVKKGDIIAELENDLNKVNLREAEINLLNAETKLTAEKIRFGQSNLENYEISPHILKNLYHKSGYLTAQNQLDKAKVLYKQTLLKAPFNGKIANLEVKTGNLIGPREVFCVIYSHNKLDVLFYVMESDIGGIRLGGNVTVVPFSNISKEYSGSITEINPFVNKQGLVKVKAQINSPNNLLLEGMNVKVTVRSEFEGLTVIPKKALVFRSNKEVVFTAQNGFAKWNDVKVQDENSSHYGLRGGLKPGDTIIISGNLNLTHNSEIKGKYTPPNS